MTLQITPSGNTDLARTIQTYDKFWKIPLVPYNFLLHATVSTKNIQIISWCDDKTELNGHNIQRENIKQSIFSKC
jgi:hypothetical protein